MGTSEAPNTAFAVLGTSYVSRRLNAHLRLRNLFVQQNVFIFAVNAFAKANKLLTFAKFCHIIPLVCCIGCCNQLCIAFFSDMNHSADNIIVFDFLFSPRNATD